LPGGWPHAAKSWPTCGGSIDWRLPPKKHKARSQWRTPRRRTFVDGIAAERPVTNQGDTTVFHWPEPQSIPNDLPPVMPFDFGILPDSFGPFVQDVAERMQCPPDFPAGAIMVAMAGAVGKKIGIRPKRLDDWLVAPNLWGAVIGRPGIMKTPAIRQPMKFLKRLEMEAKHGFEQAVQDHQNQLLIVEIRKNQKKRALEKAIKDKRDPEEVAKEFEIEEPKEPKLKRYEVNDSTVEKLGELLNENPMGLLVFRDELIGLLRKLDSPGQEGARAFYLEAWDGLGTFVYDRIGRGTIYIESVILSVLGGIQPGRLLDYLGAALKGGAGDDGLFQRFQIMVYPDVAKGWRNVDRWPDTIAKQKVWEVFQQLDALDPMAIGAEKEDGDDSVPFLHFASDAQGLFDAWRTKLEENIRSGEDHPAVEAHLSKYRSLVPTLALLIHLAESGHGPVGQQPTLKAMRWAAYLESHARRVYSIVINPATAAGKALAKRIERGELRDGFTLRQIYRKHWAGLGDKEAVEQGIDLLLELGWLKEAELITGGRNKVYYRINPSLLTKTAPDSSDKSAKSLDDTPFGTFVTGPPSHFENDSEVI
jgi:putative DNA primase/helicase